MIFVTLMLCFIFSLVYVSTKRDLEKSSIQMMETIAANPVRSGRPNEWPEEVRLPYFVIQTGEKGELVTVDGGYFDLSDEDFLKELLQEITIRQEQIGVLSEYRLRYLRTDTPTGQCIVLADMTSESATLNSLVKTCVLIGGTAFLIFLGISILLAHWAVDPIDKAWKGQKQFVADASHELKTPLTVIMTNAELLNGEEEENPEKRQFSHNILIMAKQMRGLVESLLELERLDNVSIKTECSRVSLSEITQEAILPFEPVFFEKEMTLVSEIEPQIIVNGNQAYLKQLVDILLDNAGKYGIAGGRTVVGLSRISHNRCRLWVSDQGDAIPEENLKNLFHRFYRGDKARTMNHSYGLGLSIAESIVEKHHGRIWAESKDGYNYFYVELPLG